MTEHVISVSALEAFVREFVANAKLSSKDNVKVRKINSTITIAPMDTLLPYVGVTALEFAGMAALAEDWNTPEEDEAWAYLEEDPRWQDFIKSHTAGSKLS